MKKTRGPGRPPVRIPREILVDAIMRSNGVLLRAAEMVGISRRAFYERVSRDQVLKEACRDALEKMIDFAECKLFEAISRGEPWAVIFFLRCRAKHRGWVQSPFESGGSQQNQAVHHVDTTISDERRRNVFSIIRSLVSRHPSFLPGHPANDDAHTNAKASV